MTEFPIKNSTKKTLWFDVDYKRQQITIEDEDIDGLDMSIEPQETIVLQFGGIQFEGFKIKDKDGKIENGW